MLDINRLDELKYAMELGATIPFDKGDGSFTLELYDQLWWCLRQEYRGDNCILSSVDWEQFKREVVEWMLSEDNPKCHVPQDYEVLDFMGVSIDRNRF